MTLIVASLPAHSQSLAGLVPHGWRSARPFFLNIGSENYHSHNQFTTKEIASGVTLFLSSKTKSLLLR